MVINAARDILEWLKTQSETTEAIATAGTANSYCQFKETTKTFITLLRSLSRAYERFENQGRATFIFWGCRCWQRHRPKTLTREVPDGSKIWAHLVRADDARRHGQDLAINLNQTGLLDAVVKRHSAKKSTAYAIGCGGGVVAAIWGACALTGWPVAAVIAVGCVTALVTGSKSLEHKEYRDRIRQGRWTSNLTAAPFWVYVTDQMYSEGGF